MYKFVKYFITQKNPSTKEYNLYDSIYIQNKNKET